MIATLVPDFRSSAFLTSADKCMQLMFVLGRRTENAVRITRREGFLMTALYHMIRQKRRAVERKLQCI